MFQLIFFDEVVVRVGSGGSGFPGILPVQTTEQTLTESHEIDRTVTIGDQH